MSHSSHIDCEGPAPRSRNGSRQQSSVTLLRPRHEEVQVLGLQLARLHEVLQAARVREGSALLIQQCVIPAPAFGLERFGRVGKRFEEAWGSSRQATETVDVSLEKFERLGTHFEKVLSRWCQIVETVEVGLERF